MKLNQRLAETGFVLTLLGFIWLGSCGEVKIVETIDPAVQYADDQQLIAEYLDLNEYSFNDTTESGTRVVVFEAGEGISPEEGSIVKIDYAARLLQRDSLDDVLDTTFFATTIDSVTDIHGLISTDPQIVYTYSNTGWTLLESVVGTGYITGFREGVTNLIGSINEGGNGEIIIPSAAGYGTTGSGGVIPANTVIIFKIYLSGVTP